MYYRHHGFTPYSIDLSNVHIVKYFGVIRMTQLQIPVKNKLFLIK